MRCAFWLLLLLLVLPLGRADDKPAKKPNPVGKYDAEGTNPNGTTYTASVAIKAVGETFRVEWDLGRGVAYVGVGILTDATLSVGWVANGTAGAMVYVIEKDGTLSGKWAILGDDKGRVQKETLTKKIS